jgi:predicted transcriptional regulator
MESNISADIKRLVDAGLSKNKIARKLGCAKSTVTFYCSPKYRAKRLVQQRKRRNDAKAFIVDMLGGKCVHCGYNRCLSALESHHLDETKKARNVKKCSMAKYSMAFIKREIKKCVLLCSNHHREVHAGLLVL